MFSVDSYMFSVFIIKYRRKDTENKEAIMSEFSKRLTNLRESRDLTKTKMANKIGVSLSTYANWEYGYNDPDMNTLGKIANILDTTVDYLTGNTDDPSPRSSNLSSTDLADILDNVRSYDGKTFDEHDKELLTTFLKGLYADK